MEENKIGYYAIIPANVRYDENLTPNAKLLYGEITALCNIKGFCWATNEYFADLYNVSTRTITDWIKRLEDSCYIKTNIETKRYDDGTIKKIRYIYINNHIEEKVQNHIEVLRKNHIEENFSYNNTIYNNIIYNNIVEYLNKKTNSSFKSSTKSTQRHIQARLKEGFVEDDFKKVIEIKTEQWLKDNKMKQYLRPETLFGTKFEGYLQEYNSLYENQTKKEKNNYIIVPSGMSNEEFNNAMEKMKATRPDLKGDIKGQQEFINKYFINN